MSLETTVRSKQIIVTGKRKLKYSRVSFMRKIYRVLHVTWHSFSSLCCIVTITIKQLLHELNDWKGKQDLTILKLILPAKCTNYECNSLRFMRQLGSPVRISKICFPNPC